MRDPARQGVRLAAAIAAAFFVVLGFTSQAFAVTIVAADRCCSFVDGPFEQPRGEVARFLNPSTAGAVHNVVASSSGPDGRELFFSETIQPGGEVPVSGTQYLDTGTYPFVCTIHPGMDGKLSVSSEGVPATRPVVRAAIPSQSLRQVVRKGGLRVLATSVTGASGVALRLGIGKSQVGTLRSIRLRANRSSVLTVRLSSKGKRVLRGRRSVTFRVTATVPFGSSSNAKKVIR